MAGIEAGEKSISDSAGEGQASHESPSLCPLGGWMGGGDRARGSKPARHPRGWRLGKSHTASPIEDSLQGEPPSLGFIVVHGRTSVTALLGPAPRERMEGLNRPKGWGGVQGSGLPSRETLTPWGLQWSPRTGTQW